MDEKNECHNSKREKEDNEKENEKRWVTARPAIGGPNY